MEYTLQGFEDDDYLVVEADDGPGLGTEENPDVPFVVICHDRETGDPHDITVCANFERAMAVAAGRIAQEARAGPPRKTAP